MLSGGKEGSPRPGAFPSSPLEGVASASELLGCPGALLLCRSSPEAPPREWSGAKATSFGGPERPLSALLSPSPTGRSWVEGVRLEKDSGLPALWELEGAECAGWAAQPQARVLELRAPSAGGGGAAARGDSPVITVFLLV